MEIFGESVRPEHQKSENIEIILRGDVDAHCDRITAYSMVDVDDTIRLLKKVLPHVDLKRAVYRGRYIRALSSVSYIGIPVDLGNYRRITSNWEEIKHGLVKDHPIASRLFEGSTLKESKLAEWITTNRFDWPKTATGKFSTSVDTWDAMEERYPQVKTLAQLIKTVEKIRNFELEVGTDGRCRHAFFPFGIVTGRHAYSSNRYPFNLPGWLRTALIKPGPAKR